MVTREFLEERATGIGGSDAPIILGYSKWSSPLQLWAQKVRALEGDIDPPGDDEKEAEELRWGRLIEPLLVKQFGRETGRPVRHGDLFARHPEIHWLIGHADGAQELIVAPKKKIVGPPSALIECKNVSRWLWEDWLEDAPLPVKIQGQHYLAAFDLEIVTAVALIGGNRLLYYDVERNQKFIDAMLEAEERFWARVVSDNPPPATAADHKFLNMLVKEAPGTTVQMPSEALDFHDELAGVKNEIDKIKTMLSPLEEKQKDLEAKIKQQMGDASEATLPDGSSYTFKTTKRKGFTVEPTEFRTLRYKKARG